MSSKRLWVLLVSIGAFTPVIPGCGDERFPYRCGAHPPAEDHCLRESSESQAGGAALRADGGAVSATSPDAAQAPEPDRSDAGSGDPPPNDFTTGPRCAGPMRYFAPGCPGVAWVGNPDHFAVQISPGCYRPCTRAHDAICERGTRCGRAAFAAMGCSGSSCSPVCAETWLCLPLDRFERDAGFEDDAGLSEDLEEDAGWR